MSDLPAIWMRQERRPDERRAPLSPEDAERLILAGLELTVEEAPQRAFDIEAYAAVGARIAPGGSWVEDAGDDQVILGLKELPDAPAALRHRHVYFGHAYKGQEAAADLLARFRRGGGRLLDLEYLLDPNGRRLAAFGYWAGYAGAALGVLCARGSLRAPLTALSRKELDEQLRDSAAAGGPPVRALVVGANGRSGRGALDALETAGLSPTAWDIEETRDLDRAALLAHDLLVNCVLSTGPTTPFVRPSEVTTGERRLATIVDVSCDVGSPANTLPIYDAVTTWAEPVRRLHDSPPLDIIAVDHLPSLLPLEASTAFSADLWAHLADLPARRDDPETGGPWETPRRWFDQHAPVSVPHGPQGDTITHA